MRPPDLRNAGGAARFVHHADRTLLRAIAHAGPARSTPSTWTLQDRRRGRTRRSRCRWTRSRSCRRSTITATLECAGNGRAFFEPAVAGIQWEKGAVGTARFTGARMSEVLKKAGVKTTGLNRRHARRRSSARHDAGVRAPGADGQGDASRHAHRLGHERPADSAAAGLPLRAIVPGWEGAYSVKWLTSLNVLAKESDSFWVATGYRYPNKRVAPGAAVDAKDMAPLTGLAVKSLITTAARRRDACRRQDRRRRICVGRRERHHQGRRLDRQRRDVASRRGSPASRRGSPGGDSNSTSRATKPQSYLMLSRATDSAGNMQPAVSQWNPSGYLWNQSDSRSRSR